ncbi:MFS transporter [bacterium]|nr:MFS transporter [bacterium]
MNFYYYLVSFFVEFSGILTSVALPFYLTEILKVSRMTIGFTGFIWSFSYTITTVISSKSPNYKKSISYVYTPFFAGITFLLIPFLPLYLIFSILFLTGIFYGRFWPSIQNYFQPYSHTSSVGFFNLSWSIGAISGTLLSGVFYSFHPKFPFFIAGILCLFSTIGFFIFVKNFHPEREKFSDREEDKEEKSERFSMKVVNEIRISNFITFFIIGTLSFLFPRYGLELGLSPSFISSMLTIVITVRTLTFFLLVKRPVIFNSKFLLNICMINFICLVLIALFNKSFIFTLSFIIMGFLGAITYHNSLLIHLKSRLPAEIHEAIIGAGLFSGPLIGGVIAQISDFKIAFISLGIMIILIYPFHKLLKRT